MGFRCALCTPMLYDVRSGAKYSDAYTQRPIAPVFTRFDVRRALLQVSRLEMRAERAVFFPARAPNKCRRIDLTVDPDSDSLQCPLTPK
jgi:hypothetical protein